MNSVHILFSTWLKLHNTFIYHATRMNYRDHGRMVQHINMTDQTKFQFSKQSGMNYSCITQIHLIRSLILRKFRMQFLETKISVNIFLLVVKERKLLHRSSQKLRQHKLLDKPIISCFNWKSNLFLITVLLGLFVFGGMGLLKDG